MASSYHEVTQRQDGGVSARVHDRRREAGGACNRDCRCSRVSGKGYAQDRDLVERKPVFDRLHTPAITMRGDFIFPNNVALTRRGDASFTRGVLICDQPASTR